MPNKWTAGPWKWVFDGSGPVAYLRAESAIAISSCPNFDGLDPIIDDGSAGGEYEPTINWHSPNARLIAAAPDLYEALKALTEAASPHATNRGHLLNSKLIETCELALAKARGESQ